jgi:DNA-binding beta-propeller fold protein YncE
VRVLLSMGLVVVGVATPAFPADAPKPAAPAPSVQLSWPAPTLAPLKLVAAIPASPGARNADSAASPVRLTKPFGVAVDAGGRVFIADPGSRALAVWDREKGTATRWKGNAAHQLVGPVAVAADRDGRVFAVDGFQARIVVFGPDGVPVAEFGKDVLKRPEGIAIDSAAGRIYVGDVKLHRVLVFDLRTLKMDRAIGGNGGLRFDSPALVAVNSKGQVLVSDGWNCSVHILDGTGALVRRFQTQCGKRGEFGRPNAIAVDSRDRIYVADPNSDSLQIFEPAGKPLQFVRNLNKQARAGAVRTGLAIDREDRIYIVDQSPGEGRLQIYSRSQSTPGTGL